MIDVRFVKTTLDAKVPTKAEIGSNGYDVYSIEDGCLLLNGRKCFSTGIKLELPPGYVCMVCPRSGMALKAGITVLNGPGVLDQSYRGILGVILVSHSDVPFDVKKGDRIAQILFVKTEDANFIECQALSETSRNEGGFGSSGK
jgi:dUTP pyrophosphatase